jgi:hypothetical protein
MPLDKYTSLGSYPLFYIENDSDCLCVDCANAHEAPEMLQGEINWEDPSLFCDECSERIESAYAEDDAVSP